MLRQIVAVLHERGGYRWTGLWLVEEDGLVLGPSTGADPPGAPTLAAAGGPYVPVLYEGRPVGVLGVTPEPSGPGERAFLDRVARLISAHCLVGWDTGGVDWADVS